MRKLFLTLLVGAIVFGCTKDTLDPNNPSNQPPVDPLEVKREQNAFGVNFSGNWCGPCGSSGIPAIYSAREAHGSRVNIIKVGLNGSGAPDPFFVTSGSELASAYYPPGPRGIPGFGAGINFHQGNAPWREEMNSIIATPATQVKAGVAITKEIKGDSLIFKVRMKAFEALPTGIYAVTVFVVEDGLVAPQAGQAVNPFTHNMVFRGQAFDRSDIPYGLWGHIVGASNQAAAVPANTTKEWRFGFAKPEGMTPAVNLANTYAYAVMTRLNASDYKPMAFINSARTK
jgi:hypothetical protein